MSNKTTTPMAELMEQTLQAGLKLQEESSKWWTNLMAQTATPADWQKHWNTPPGETIRVLQKNMDDSLHLFEQGSRTSLELLKQAVATTTMATTAMDSTGNTQAKLQEMWEASLAALRNNAQAVTQANAKVVESWMQLFAMGTEAGSVNGTKGKGS